MTNDTMSLRVLQKDVSLKEVFNQDFLKKLEESFDNLEIIPVGIAFVLKDSGINEDMINISYRNDEEIKSNTVLIDVQTNPKNMDIIRKAFDGN